MQKKILIMEDNKRVLEILAFAVGREGYHIIRASDGQTGIPLVQERRPDLIVLDLTRTTPDSLDVYKTLRGAGVETPILLLLSSERQAEELQGQFDYIEKPFPMQELLMRIKVGLWDMDADSEAAETECLILGRIVIYPEKVLVTKDGIPLDLTQREYDLLLFLAREPGKVFSREELLTSVWNYSYLGDMQNVNVAVRRLREKIEDDPANPTTVVAVGHIPGRKKLTGKIIIFAEHMMWIVVPAQSVPSQK